MIHAHRTTRPRVMGRSNHQKIHKHNEFLYKLNQNNSMAMKKKAAKKAVKKVAKKAVKKVAKKAAKKTAKRK